MLKNRRTGRLDLKGRSEAGARGAIAPLDFEKKKQKYGHIIIVNLHKVLNLYP